MRLEVEQAIVRMIEGDGESLEIILHDNSMQLTDEEKVQALSSSCGAGNTKIAKFLLEQRVPISSGALIGAIHGGKVEILEEFLKYDWDIDSRIFGATTALCSAVHHEGLLLWFLDHGADPNAKQYASNIGFYRTPTSEAALYESTSRMELLLYYGAEIDSLTIFSAMTAREAGDRIAMMKLLIEHGAELNGEGTGTYTIHAKSPLHCAVGMGRKDFVELLLQGGAKPNLERFGDKTPAALALEQGKLDLYEILTNWS
ncbi:hypothetical protein TWF694_003032 [Orbilia ellipsospora]|uniref:Ankyrin repeat protein n=1 Tax=Orbilia ellipsospora TaxID=2528407 RepID=A0AAV9X2Y4_9PEZI